MFDDGVSTLGDVTAAAAATRDAQVQLVETYRAAYRNGWSVAHIAEAAGVSRQTVYKALQPIEHPRPPGRFRQGQTKHEPRSAHAFRSRCAGTRSTRSASASSTQATVASHTSSTRSQRTTTPGHSPPACCTQQWRTFGRGCSAG